MKKIKLDTKLQVKIISITDDAMGVAKIDNDFVIFVIGGITGDEVIIRIIKSKKNYAIGEIVNFVKISKLSVIPHDKYSEISGGCSISRMKYEYQLIEKQNILKSALEKIGGFYNLKIEPIISMQEPFRYRNKSVYPCGINSSNEVDFGYFKPRTHQVIFEKDSIIEHEQNSKILNIIKKWANKYKIEPYDEKTHKGLLRSIMIRNSYENKHMVGIIGNSNSLPHSDKLVEMLNSNFDNISSIVYNINKLRGNKIMTNNYTILHGNNTIRDRLGNLKFDISMPAFFQVNRIQTERMYELVLEYANLTSKMEAWDLYCGIGTISLYLSKHCKFVRGNEYNEIAVKNAFENAKLNNISNVDFQSGLAEEVVPIWLKKFKNPDVVVLDPARKGADINVLRTIIKASPERIVYVSCKPSTLARDLKVLSSDYKIIKVQPIDLFPHTTHIETVVLLQKII